MEVNEEGILTRSSLADSGVSMSGGSTTPTTSLDKRLVATPGCRRPMSMCERMLVERARDQFSQQRRPPISVRTTSLHRKSDDRRVEGARSNSEPPAFFSHVTQDVKKRESPQRHDDNATEQRLLHDEEESLLAMMNDGIAYVDYLINKTEEMTRKLNESTDSEGICADMGYRKSSSSGRGSMTSSSIIQTDRMFLSTMSTPRRPPSRIPALMTKSLHAPRSNSTPQRGPSAYGSGEQLCHQEYGSYRWEYGRQQETEMLLSRSQDRRQQRASSYDPRCLLALHPSSSLRLSTSASASIYSTPSASSFSRLLPKRPKWIRHQPTVLLAESTVSLDSLGGCQMKKSTGGFYLDSDEDSDSGEDSVDPGDSMEEGTPKKRPKKLSLRKLKEKNRKKFRKSMSTNSSNGKREKRTSPRKRRPKPTFVPGCTKCGEVHMSLACVPVAPPAPAPVPAVKKEIIGGQDNNNNAPQKDRNGTPSSPPAPVPVKKGQFQEFFRENRIFSYKI
ncbi:hypothetical protein CAEBREN_11920 [Caenorhabditis brenneri]|uniref:Uncharacterized protein n=1 Tax=Caenorhabditis brenneri TaxID=135651 RepID=G0PG33_CAEBE|nr:hypothetical protein CAEBREN_11920 [Caenorhabditis brenneri]